MNNKENTNKNKTYSAFINKVIRFSIIDATRAYALGFKTAYYITLCFSEHEQHKNLLVMHGDKRLLNQIINEISGLVITKRMKIKNAKNQIEEIKAKKNFLEELNKTLEYYIRTAKLEVLRATDENIILDRNNNGVLLVGGEFGEYVAYPYGKIILY
jgi:CxxC motif-containing protein